MKKVLLITVTIAAVIALGNVILASAQGGSLPTPSATCPNGYTCPFSGTIPYRGMMGAYGTYSGTLPYGGMQGMHNFMMGTNSMHQQVWTAVAQKLGMSYAQLAQAVQNGQSIEQLAQAKGVSLDDLSKAAVDAMKASLADLVKQGVMTQEQADWMLDRMDDMPMYSFGQGFGPGMMNGWQNSTPNNGAQPNRSYGPGMMGRGSRGMMPGWQQPTSPQG